MNYQAPLSPGGGGAELKDRLTPKAIVAALDEHIVGQGDATALKDRDHAGPTKLEQALFLALGVDAAFDEGGATVATDAYTAERYASVSPSRSRTGGPCTATRSCRGCDPRSADADNPGREPWISRVCAS